MLSNRRRLARWMIPPAAVAAGLCAWLGMSPVQAVPVQADVLPDLVADPPTNLILQTDAQQGSEPRLLLRFEGYVHNSGAGALEVRADRNPAGQMPVRQRIFNVAGGSRDDPSSAELVFETGDGHNHWHVKHAARYSLWDAAGEAMVAPAMKAGFCLIDSQPIEAPATDLPVYGPTSASPRYSGFCAANKPNAPSTWQGLSAGWRDIYARGLAFQWVDASVVQPGQYRLRSDVDPDGVLRESVEANAPAWAADLVTIPGYVAQPVSQVAVPSSGPGTVTLAAKRFEGSLGKPGPLSYRIESAPAHGTLSLATGASQQEPTVTYTPNPGFGGVDSFTYSARDGASAFPRSPAIATVSLNVAVSGDPTVQIGGAPESMIAGTSVQLQATVSNDKPGVTWSADDGTITPAGRYTAPGQPPASGSVLIAARTAGGGIDERRVRILPVPTPTPAPLPEATSAPSESAPPEPPVALTPPAPTGPADLPPAHDRGDHQHPPAVVKHRAESRSRRAYLLRGLDVARIGRRLVISVTPARRGRVRLAAYVADRSLGECSTLTPGGRRFTCRTRIPRQFDATVDVRVIASLRQRGRLVAFHRSRAAPAEERHHH